MKIFTGKFSGRIIHREPGPNLRPTADKVRQAIFNTLQGALEGKRVLDLFSGTGALGFEALSNGAEQVMWVESDRDQARGIERTLKTLDLPAGNRIILSDALKALALMAKQEGYFDFIFLDPPYKTGLGVKAMAILAQSALFHEETIFILETHKTEDPPTEFGKLGCIKTKKHGDTKISYYRSIL